jgi:ribose-phosphate pyrophosphokinase
MNPLVCALPGNEFLAARLCAILGWDSTPLRVHRFPDGETYVRYPATIAGRTVVLVCTLDRPDDKSMALMFAAHAARENGAAAVGLVAPYLAYMRQDAVFQPGEGVTSVAFARFVGSFADWMVTVDPHLHRHPTLDTIYAIPTRVVHAAPALSAWIAQLVPHALVVGPDGESEQWAAEVARGAGCPCAVLHKVRHGDRDVEVSLPEAAQWQDRTPVLVDDIVSTAVTMAAAARMLGQAGLGAPVCLAVHPVFAPGAEQALRDAGIARVVSCNTIAHASNAVDLAQAIAPAVRERAGLS